MPSTLLIVEDSSAIGTLMEKIVRRERADTVFLSATNGKAGVELARQYEPDLVILDWMMPNFGGEYFLEQQKKDPRIADIPVIVHSALPASHLDERLEDFPAVKECIQKPVQPVRLWDRIQTYLQPQT